MVTHTEMHIYVADVISKSQIVFVAVLCLYSTLNSDITTLCLVYKNLIINGQMCPSVYGNASRDPA